MPSKPGWRFGPFEVDADDHRLLRDGEPVALTRKPLSLLMALLERAGRLVTKAELFDAVWAGTVVSEAALSRAVHELRAALGDAAATPRYIATVHGLGFRFVAAVDSEKAAAARPNEGMSATAPPSRLVARENELAFLDVALAVARSGRRQMVFVTGEAGIGKTAVVEAFLERQAGCSELWAAQGRCVEQYGTGEAFLPLLEALENLAPQVGAGSLRETLARYAPGWLAQLPWLAGPTPALAPRQAGAASSARGMLREIAQALEVLAAQRPLLLWLEDLHWSDPSTLSALSFIAGRAQPARLLIVASFRPADARHNESPLHALAPLLAQRNQARELALGLLDAAAIAALLSNRFGKLTGVSVEALAAFVHRRTEGNALFVVTLVEDMVRRGLLAPEPGGWHFDAQHAELASDLPESLRQLVQLQFGNLDATERRLIEAAAVAGTEFSAASVAAALQQDTTEVEDRCALLAEQGRFLRPSAPVAWPDGTVAAGYSFVHALYWHGVDERVGRSRRTEWQQRIARRQQAAWGDQGLPIAGELAMRFEQAGDIALSLRYLLMAGAGALARHAYVESIGLLRHALGLLPRLPAEARPRQELELLLPLGAALMAAQGYASGDAQRTYRRALELCRDHGQPGELDRVLRGLWNVDFIRADLTRAATAAEELLDHAASSERPDLAFDAWTKLGQTSMHRGDFAVARQRLEQALSLPVSATDRTRRRESPRTTAYLAWVLWYTGEPERALARGEEALALAADAKSAHSSAFAFGFISWLHLFCGDLPRALALAKQQHAVCVEHGLVYWQVWAEFTFGLTDDANAHSARRADAMRAALQAMRDTGVAVGIPHFLCLLAERELVAGRPDRAAADLAAAQALMTEHGNDLSASEAARLQGVLALVRGGPESRETARRHFGAALAIARGQQAISLELRAAADLARLWAVEGDHAKGEALLGPVLESVRGGDSTADVIAAATLLASLRSATTSRAPR